MSQLRILDKDVAPLRYSPDRWSLRVETSLGLLLHVKPSSKKAVLLSSNYQDKQ